MNLKELNKLIESVKEDKELSEFYTEKKKQLIERLNNDILNNLKDIDLFEYLFLCPEHIQNLVKVFNCGIITAEQLSNELTKFGYICNYNFDNSAHELKKVI
tara:strand:+ start:716 stop:1021 length:306 start_codon:yes stop_codon:yes gene_type:complete